MACRPTSQGWDQRQHPGQEPVGAAGVIGVLVSEVGQRLGALDQVWEAVDREAGRRGPLFGQDRVAPAAPQSRFRADRLPA